jgi:ATP-binding cassette subfamily C protein
MTKPNTAYLHALWQFRPRLAGSLLALMLASGLTEGVSLALLIPLLQYAGLNTTSTHTSTSLITDLFHPTHTLSLFSILVIYILLVGIAASFNYFKTTFGNQLKIRFIAHWRDKLYQAICHLPYQRYREEKPANIHHILTGELQRVSAATNALLALLATSITTLCYLTIALSTAWRITVVTLAATSALLLLTRKYTAFAKKSGQGLTGQLGQLHQLTEQSLQGMRQAKLWQGEAQLIQQMHNIDQKLIDARQRFGQAQAKTAWLFTSGGVLIFSSIFYIEITWLHLALTQALLLLLVFARLLPKVNQLQQNYQQLSHLSPGFNTIDQLYRKCLKHQESLHSHELPPLRFQEHIKLKHIHFHYANKPVLQNININIPFGQTLAISGRSGSGKSTLADLISGLTQPSSGEITIDDCPLTADNLKRWRRQVAYVSQDPYLLNESIHTNLLWAAPQATEQDMIEALELTAANFVFTLPQGLDTPVGHRGMALSTGQRQRISLAQALLRNAKLLILDESTSNLDAENEQAIITALSHLQGKLTILLISHHGQLKQLADQHWQLHNGQLQCLNALQLT